MKDTHCATGCRRSLRYASSAGGSLFRKLRQRQSTQPRMNDLPFVIAVEDFVHVELPHGAPPSHELGAVRQEGFLGLAEAQHISGILFCCDATVMKFNRLAHARPGVERAEASAS